MVRYLKLLITDGHASDSHVLLARIFKEGDIACVKSLAQIELTVTPEIVLEGGQRHHVLSRLP